MKGIIVLGSSRSDGETAAIVSLVRKKTGFELIDLLNFDIDRFDYKNSFSEDDFLPIAKRIAEEAETLVFATPVYWYSMSGIMKDFIDRFTDLIRFEKEIGRKFRGKRMALLSSSSGPVPPDYFVRPFEDTASYLGMSFLGHLHSWSENGETSVPKIDIDRFAEVLLKWP